MQSKWGEVCWDSLQRRRQWHHPRFVGWPPFSLYLHRCWQAQRTTQTHHFHPCYTTNQRGLWRLSTSREIVTISLLFSAHWKSEFPRLVTSTISMFWAAYITVADSVMMWCLQSLQYYIKKYCIVPGPKWWMTLLLLLQTFNCLWWLLSLLCDDKLLPFIHVKKIVWTVVMSQFRAEWNRWSKWLCLMISY